MSTDVGVQVSSSAPRRRELRIVCDGVFFFQQNKQAAGFPMPGGDPRRFLLDPLRRAELMTGSNVAGYQRPTQKSPFCRQAKRDFFIKVIGYSRILKALQQKDQNTTLLLLLILQQQFEFICIPSAAGGFFSVLGGLFCRFSLTMEYRHIILKVRFRTLG